MLNIVKNTTILSPLDLIAPHSCRGCGHIGSVLCDRCKNYLKSQQAQICPQCKSPKTHTLCPKCTTLPPTYIAGERTNLLSLLIHDFKYNSIRALARPLAELMFHSLPHFDSQIAIIPLPTIGRHIRARGLDHTLLIAKHLSRLIGPNCYVERALIRHKNTVQVGTDKETRLSQANSAYQLNPKFNPNPDTLYILFDDVWTTGASMLAANSLIQKSGASHTALAILAVSHLN